MQIAELSTSLLPGHPRIVALENQSRDLTKQIRAEARKILKSLETAARVARRLDLGLIADQTRTRFFRGGDSLLREGEPIGAVHIIVEGPVQMRRGPHDLGQATSGAGVGGIGFPLASVFPSNHSP